MKNLPAKGGQGISTDLILIAQNNTKILHYIQDDTLRFYCHSDPPAGGEESTPQLV